MAVIAWYVYCPHCHHQLSTTAFSPEELRIGEAARQCPRCKTKFLTNRREWEEMSAGQKRSFLGQDSSEFLWIAGVLVAVALIGFLLHGTFHSGALFIAIGILFVFFVVSMSIRSGQILASKHRTQLSRAIYRENDLRAAANASADRHIAEKPDKPESGIFCNTCGVKDPGPNHCSTCGAPQSTMVAGESLPNPDGPRFHTDEPTPLERQAADLRRKLDTLLSARERALLAVDLHMIEEQIRRRPRWQPAADGITTVFPGLRKDFYEHCLEALDWNVSRGIIKSPRSRRKPLSGYTEISIIAFQMWTVRAASLGLNYLDATETEALFDDLGVREGHNEADRSLLMEEMGRLHNCYNDDPELCSFWLASSVAAHFYGEYATESDRRAATEDRLLPPADRMPVIKLFAKVVPSFYLRLNAAVARAFGDTKTANEMEMGISRMRAEGAGY